MEAVLTEAELTDLKHNISSLRQASDNTQNALHRIEVALLSDEKMGRIGLVSQVQQIRNKVNEIDDVVKQIQIENQIKKAVDRTKTTIYGAIGASIIMFGKWLIGIFLSH